MRGLPNPCFKRKNQPNAPEPRGQPTSQCRLYIVAITRMRNHEATKNYVIKRTAQGKSKREITRCLKRYIIREIYHELCVPNDAKTAR